MKNFKDYRDSKGPLKLFDEQGIPFELDAPLLMPGADEDPVLRELFKINPTINTYRLSEAKAYGTERILQSKQKLDGFKKVIEAKKIEHQFTKPLPPIKKHYD